MFKKAQTILILLVLFTACAGPKMNLREMSQKGLLLVYNPALNSTQKYHVVFNVETVQEMMGQEQKFTMNRDVILTQKVTSADKNILHYSINFDSLEMNTTIPMMANYTEFKDKLLKTTILLETDRRGNVQKIAGIEELPQAPAGMDISTNMKNFFVIFPEKILKVGDSWDEEKTINVPSGPLTIDVKLKSQYTLVGVEPFQGKDCFKIHVTTQITMSGSGNQGGMDLVYDGTGTSEGDIYYDYLAGVLASLTSKQSTEGVVSLPAQGMKIPMTSSQSETMERLLQ